MKTTRLADQAAQKKEVSLFCFGFVARHARHYFTFWVCQCMFYLGNTNKKSNSRPIFFQTARNETKRDQMQ